MSDFLVKIDPDGTTYALWSTFNDQPFVVGERPEIEDAYRDLYGQPADEWIPRKFALADATGSSSLVGSGRWGKPLTATSGDTGGEVPRERLSEFCSLIMAEQYDAAAALIVPDPDDD
jgi:hypothetical protein